MALLKKLRDLITQNRDYQDFEDPYYGDFEGDGDPGGGGSPEPAILPPSPPGPLPKLGRTSTTTLPNPATNGGYAGGGPPQQSFGRRLRGAIPGILDAAITAGATQNVAGGGPTDIFRAMKAVGDDKDKKKALALKQADLQAQEQLRRAQAADYATRAPGRQATLDERATHDRATEGTGGRNATTAETKAAETERNNRANNAIRGQANVISGAGKGFEVPDVMQPGGLRIVAPPNVESPAEGSGEGQPIAPTAGYPAIRPTPRENLPAGKQVDIANKEADTVLKGAQTGTAQARTADLQQHTKLAPEALELRRRMIGQGLSRIANEQERIKLAKDTFNLQWLGKLPDGTDFYHDPETGENVSPKLLAVTKLSAAATAKVNQAASVIDATDRAKKGLQALAAQGKIGPGSGRYEDTLASIGVSSPDVKAALVDIDNLASLLPATHGMRGTHAYENFKKTIGGIGQNPENAYAALDEIKAMSQDIVHNNSVIRRAPSGHPATTKPAAAPPSATASPVQMLSKNGTPMLVPADKVEDAIKNHGAKRVQ